MDSSPGTQYDRARKVISVIEYQLQLLEENPGYHARGAASNGTDDARASLSENINLLQNEVSAFERLVAQQFGEGISAAGMGAPPKGQLWKKRLSLLQTEATALRKTVERFLRASYPTSYAAQEREQLLGGGVSEGCDVTMETLIMMMHVWKLLRCVLLGDWGLARCVSVMLARLPVLAQ